MTFVKLLPSAKKFGARETRTISVVVPIDEYETIKATIKEFVDNFSEDNIKKIYSVQEGMKETISFLLDIVDYIESERSITEDKYQEILRNHNLKLLNEMYDKFPIERKKPVKSLIEEKIEKKLMRLEEQTKREEQTGQKEIVSSKNYGNYNSPRNNMGMYGTPEYNKNLDKLIAKSRKNRK